MKSKTAGRILSMFILLGYGLFTSSTVMAATTITVNTTLDSIADDGQFSLREAVIAARIKL